MSKKSDFEDVKIEGIINERLNYYYIITDEGKTYVLSGSVPWRGGRPGQRLKEFEKVIGKRVLIKGMSDGDTIWKAQLLKQKKGKPQKKEVKKTRRRGYIQEKER